ncbi:MAG TPA: OsmC family protein [Spirochaetia bacterium]|nr:OsmC family protein [Spirochaetia bacterium]
MGAQTYEVRIERSADGLHVRSAARDFTLELGAHRGDPAAGFNAVETLLSAVGACFSTSFGMVAELSQVPIDGLQMKIVAERQDKPPTVTAIRYIAFIKTDADDGKIDRLVALAERNSTVISTLRGAIPVSGEWRRYEKRSH